MTVPRVNASVTQIAGGGTSDDYGTDAGSDTIKDSASHNAYLDEELVAVPNAGKLDLLRKSFLVVDYDVGKIVANDDSVTYIFDGTTSTRRVQTIRLYKLFGSARIYFYDA